MKAVIAIAIRTAIREQVIQAYKEWKEQNITTKEFSTWMYDIRITSLAIVGNMAYLGILDDEDNARLETFIRSLTEVYF